MTFGTEIGIVLTSLMTFGTEIGIVLNGFDHFWNRI
jgi:hypothetical protein